VSLIQSVSLIRRVFGLVCALAGVLAAQYYTSPAGSRPALRRRGSSVLPGGRIIAPLGAQYVTGSGPFGLAVSASGRTAVTSNGGPDRNSLTVLERGRSGWEVRHILAGQDRDDAGGASDTDEAEGGRWRGVFMGVAFSGEHTLFVSEGNSGRVSILDLGSEERRRSIDLNQGDYHDSYTGDLAFDPARGILYVVDQANFRVAVIDTHSRQVTASVAVGRLPFAVALSPDRRKLYVTNVGMFAYQAIPGADPRQARATGLPFPAFGFPSPEATTGVQRRTERGPVQVPGLGDPNVRESNSLCVVDVGTPSAPKVEAFIRTGLPIGDRSEGGSSPSGVVAASGRVFVSNAGNDSITVIDAATNAIEKEIPIRIPGLESLRGVLPVGLAYDERNGWLLAAEAGINAVGIVDTRAGRVLGHLPAGWFPTRIALDRDTVLVANARGRGSGPNAVDGRPVRASARAGTISVFSMPAASGLAAQTDFVMEANGFRPRRENPPPLPDAVKHVVLIVKENRTYDEVFGDIDQARNGDVAGAPELARFGTRGYVDGRRQRLSLTDVNVTPNHHAIAREWAFSDNFYADSDVSVDGHHWLVGAYPNAWAESALMGSYSGNRDFRLGAAPGRLLFAGSDSSVHPEEQEEGGTIWHHLARHGVSFYNFGEGFELAGVNEGRDLEPTGARFLTNVPMPEPLYRNTSRQYPGFNMNIPDQYRASQLIRELDEKYVKGGVDLPQFIFIHLPNDHMTRPRPEDGYPYEASFVADNDYALGRIIEWLSGTKWWKEMAIFITEDDAQGGIDHIDAHRTVLMSAGPWCKAGYVSHTNSSFPGLLKTIFRLLHLPALNLFDASAADLSDVFTQQPHFERFTAVEPVKQLFDPASARQAAAGTQTEIMDDSQHIPGLPRSVRPPRQER
jgi:YVTN family beta-propeller protein